MPAIRCPILGCDYVTDDVDGVIAAALLTIHNNVHTLGVAADTTSSKQKPPKMERPNILKGSSEETWNTFLARWSIFKTGTHLTPNESTINLFQCCDEDLGNDILKAHPNVVSGQEDILLNVIKRLAVIPVAISARRSHLLTIKQDHGESVRSFYSKVNGKAATCAYNAICSNIACAQNVDFTDIIVKDVLISGLLDDDIKKDVLGWSELDAKSVQETVTFIEAKEMARDALNKPNSQASISSSYKAKVKNIDKSKTTCKACKAEIDKQVWNKRQNKMIDCTMCLPCWKTANAHKLKNNKNSNQQQPDEAGVISVASNDLNSSRTTVSTVSIKNPIILDHHIFTDVSGWKQAESMKHPTLTLSLTTEKCDYDCVSTSCPQIKPVQITVVTDTGAQSCLWSRKDFYRCGFKKSDLLPVKRTLLAANKEPIHIDGAIFIRLSGLDDHGNKHVAPVMVYISPDTEKFYLSRQALIQLSIISKDFPKIGASMENASIGHEKSPCGCPKRTLPPKRPNTLPYKCTPENIPNMKEWLINRYAASTFNRCAHQQLPGMSGPEIKFHIKPDAIPVAVHTPAKVPLHWQKEVEKQIQEDIALGVIEEVPIGEPSVWCHRMVITRKPDGTPRRTVDLSALNKHCLRETHHVKPPFQQASLIPQNTYKSVTDAWNGYHSVPIRIEDRHLTTFITPWGRYRYKVAPQGFLASGDAYSRRFDEIISSIQRKTKCVDDTAMWDSDLEEHWWRMIDFIELVGNNGIVLNVKKFQFSQREIEFAGLYITEREIRPCSKFLRAIEEFPSLKNLTDVRSWFGLVNQVACYNQLAETMAPFRHLLSSKNKFAWNSELESAFEKSKMTIVNSIKKGIEIFDTKFRTCLIPDWSKTGIGFYMSQKHCECPSTSPGCCDNGWKVTLAGSRFLKPSESRYSPVEGEALAIAWSLEQTKHFTQGCDNLLVITDHKPLLKLFGDRSLDEIENPRLFSLKQRTLLWRFDIAHIPGKENYFSDATSRHPVEQPTVEGDDMDICLAAIYKKDVETIRAISWKLVKTETSVDNNMLNLIKMIENGFPAQQNEMPLSLVQYWDHRDKLYIVDNVVLMKHRVVIPPSLRNEVLQSLHAAHQGVGYMNEHAKATVFWPGITYEIQAIRDRCIHCNRSSPSQAKLPPVDPWIPTSPFEAIACDYFYFKGYYYFIAADRLSGWTELRKIKIGTNEAGASGLCKALRNIFVTFGVPMEISSDGGPEFVAGETEVFLQKWAVHHRLSSAYFPSSNGRAELAVKSTKRLLMDNVDCNGNIDNDRMVRALLTQRNTPDPHSKLSPAQILFGHPLKDTLPYINKNIITYNNPQISSHWRELWRLKENSLKHKYEKTFENLREHTKSLQPLQIGDHVFVQNQSGNFPKKWDRCGIIVEVKGNDQYLVKIAGTGRLTLRNRQFLKPYVPQQQHGPNLNLSNSSDHPSSSPQVNPNTSSNTMHLVQPETKINQSTSSNTTPLVHPEEYINQSTCEPQLSNQDDDVQVQISPSPTVTDQPLINSQGNVNPSGPLRVSSRIRKPMKFYDADTGQYVNQNP